VHLSAAPSLLRAEPADPNPLSESSILRDPAVPALGNAKGDITIVEYFDYQCPYCKKVNPELAKIVRDDVFPGEIPCYRPKIPCSSMRQRCPALKPGWMTFAR